LTEELLFFVNYVSYPIITGEPWNVSPRWLCLTF